MAEVSAALVKALRERTGAGIMDCKRALAETGGDLDKAVDYLRAKGLAGAAKKAGREASEGLIGAALLDGGRLAALVEVNCETDFVARTPDFKAFVDEVARWVARTPGGDTQLAAQWGDRLAGLIAKLGENLVLRRAVRYEVADSRGLVGEYVHAGGKLGALVELVVDGGPPAPLAGLAHDLAMHVVAANPLYLRREEVPAAVLAREREIYRAQARESGKPEPVLDRIVEGKLEKFFAEVCLLEQPFALDSDKTVAEVLAAAGRAAGAQVGVRRFARFQLGEASRGQAGADAGGTGG
ncbi:MAG TPA: translation elongation factor Ts [Thermodesulfobacteriota bacterium]|nr:translation elongation factor Ts [Thermodesulfobacteriota bacterium]